MLTSTEIRQLRSCHNAADITLLRAMGYRFAIWRHNGIAWADVIPHRGESLTMGIDGQYCPLALNNRIRRILG